ncbi:unnamed protein product, partial [Leptidea sinapis]
MSDNVLDFNKEVGSSESNTFRLKKLKSYYQSGKEMEAVSLNNELVDKVMTNYVIAKEIISNLSWQEKLRCKRVCSTWYSAVKALKREQLSPADFTVEFKHKADKTQMTIQKSCQFCTEPLIVFMFTNISGFSKAVKCKNIFPCPCHIPCDYEHLVLDVVHQSTCQPKDCMLGIKSSYISYMPLPKSITKDFTLTHLEENPVTAGLYIPVIPNIKSHIIKLKCNTTLQHDFCSAIDTILTDQVIKGLVVFVTDKHLLNTVEDIVFLNYVKEVKHRMEQELFREAFPDTRIIGCYGNGELGVNHPERPVPEWPINKRSRLYSGPQFGVIYSYST